MGSQTDWPTAISRQIEYYGILERFLARGITPRDPMSWGLWTRDSKQNVVHVFLIGPGILGVAAFPPSVVVGCDISEISWESLDVLYIYRYRPATGKYELWKDTDRFNVRACWNAKRELFKAYRGVRKALLS